MYFTFWRFTPLERKINTLCHHLDVIHLVGVFCRLEGSVNRYRQLDMTIGEKEMMIAELQAK